MKKILMSFYFIAAMVTVKAQLIATPLCPPFEVNLLEGNVSNAIEPNSNAEQIKKKFPCFTSEEPDTAKCGAMVAFADNGIYFYTGRGYIELREKFKGKLSIPAMGASRSSLFQWFGSPSIKDITWDAYQTSYGILVVHFDAANKINLIQFSKKNAQSLKLCQ